MANIIGDFTGSGVPQTLSPSDLGLTFTASFTASPNSKVPHTIFEVDIPLLTNNVNDPPYYAPPGVFSATNSGTAFGSAFIGAAPDAAVWAASEIVLTLSHPPFPACRYPDAGGNEGAMSRSSPHHWPSPSEVGLGSLFCPAPGRPDVRGSFVRH